jgi:hypothetical protein
VSVGQALQSVHDVVVVRRVQTALAATPLEDRVPHQRVEPCVEEKEKKGSALFLGGGRSTWG